MFKKYATIIFICFLHFGTSAQSRTADSLKILLKKATHDTVKCNILLQLIANEYDDSVWPNYNTELKQIAERNLTLNHGKTIALVYERFLAEAINNEGYLASQTGNSKEALAKYYLSLSIQEKNNDKKGSATTLNNIAYVFQFQGDIDNALKYYSKSLKIYQECRDKIGIARALNNMGIIYDDQGNIPKALEYYHKSLRIREELNEKEGIASCLNNIGTIYHRQGNLDKALEYYYKGIQFQKDIDDNIGVAISLGNIGAIYLYKMSAVSYQNQALADSLYYKGLKLYEQSLALHKEYDNKKGIAGVYSSLASAYQNRSSLFNDKKNTIIKDSLKAKALSYHNLSLKIREEIQDKPGISNSLNNIAKLEVELNHLKGAKENAERSLKISRELGYPENIKNSSEILSRIYSINGDYKRAFEMQVLFKQMSDSIFNEANKKASISRSFQYAYEKKAARDSIKVHEEKKVITAQLKQEKTQRFALYGGLALVLVFSGFMVNRFIVTRKQKRIIEVKEQETQQQNVVISQQKHLVEEKQKEILDSINYAKRIQHTLLAHADFLKEHIPHHFVYFNPKDIVSGDFYWATSVSSHRSAGNLELPGANCQLFFLAVCDSTGHGVPGAFMSLLNIGFLSEAINEKNILEPNEVLNYARERLTDSISKEGQKDGFDGILMRFEIENQKIKSIKYAAANNAPILVSNNTLVELPKDRMPVGKGEKEESFAQYEVPFKSGDTIYLYTDGFADQFGGEKGKKFKYKQLNDLLLTLNTQPLTEQKNNLEKTFTSWKGNLEQVDDVLLISIKLS